MAVIVDFSQKTPSERFGVFIGEVTGKMGNLIGAVGSAAVNKMESIEHPTVQKVCEFVKTHQDSIAYGAYVLGAAYNFYTSPLIFSVGVVVGFIASASPFPVSLNSLREGELCSHTATANFAGPKAIFTLGAINMYLGDTFLDNAFFGGTAGLLFGNSLYHKVKGNAVVVASQSLLTNTAAFVNAKIVSKIFA